MVFHNQCFESFLFYVAVSMKCIIDNFVNFCLKQCENSLNLVERIPSLFKEITVKILVYFL